MASPFKYIFVSKYYRGISVIEMCKICKNNSVFCGNSSCKSSVNIASCKMKRKVLCLENIFVIFVIYRLCINNLQHDGR